MENTFASTIQIHDDADIDTAKATVLGGLDLVARSHGLAPTREQLILGTTFGIVEKENGTKLLQGIFTAA